jgi:hypothetical protein
LDAFRIDPPRESWDLKRGHVIEGDRWVAAMLLRPDDARAGMLPPPAEAAWTADGTRRLAELLPQAFDDLRAAIRARFGNEA